MPLQPAAMPGLYGSPPPVQAARCLVNQNAGGTGRQVRQERLFAYVQRMSHVAQRLADRRSQIGVYYHVFPTAIEGYVGTRFLNPRAKVNHVVQYLHDGAYDHASARRARTQKRFAIFEHQVRL